MTISTMNSLSDNNNDDVVDDLEGTAILPSHSNDNHDDDDDEESTSSEYTYETVDDDDDDDDDDESNKAKTKTNGWLSTLFSRRRQPPPLDDNNHDDDEDSYYEDEEGHGGGDDDDDEEGGGSSSSVLASDHVVVNNDHDSNNNNNDNNYYPNQQENKDQDREEDEEAILMAEAIHRVRQRIQQNGGNLYNVLSEEDKMLVDELDNRSNKYSIMEDTKRKEAAVAMVAIEEKKNQDIQKNVLVNHIYDCVPKVTEIIGEGSTQSNQDMAFLPTKGNQEQDQDPINDDTVDEDILMEKDDEEVEDDEEEVEDDEEERPTLEEQRSLLTLAAEHDRVDVIQSLLGDSSRHDSIETCGYDSLLAGISGQEEDASTKSSNDNDTFVPPPLHVAVAHGSIHAASCLLRMGADPSIRPRVDMSSSSSLSMESRGGDRNYKKYHDMSAWELAFGSSDVSHIIDEDENVGNPKMMVEDTLVKEEKPAGRWFSFRSNAAKDEIAGISTNDGNDAMPSSKMVSKDNDCLIQRRRRKQPLNIAPTKLAGIRHAFMSEALRAIGANEVHRLEQLLNSGMDPNLEVMADKTMLQWAQDMDAIDCCELLLRSGGKGMTETVVEKLEEGISSNEKQNEVVESAETHQQEHVYTLQDERVSGLSIGDLRMLISENLNLIPQLTKCRDDLASETTMCQSLLRDISATGGKGGLSSHSLLELVRTLKEQRSQAEEALAAWQSAWDEREDELNFFWEEVLDDKMREELGAILDQDDLHEEVPRDDLSTKNLDATLEGLVHHFVEVDNRVKSLRASISNLAEVSAKATAEIESRGLSGALSLTRALREEVKEIEKKIHEASIGEGACRRKIEFIQRRIDEANHVIEQSPARKDGDDDDAIIEDFQLRSIVQRHDAKVESGEKRELSPILVYHQQKVNHSTDEELTPTPVTAEQSVQSPHDVDSLHTKVEEPIQVESRTYGVTIDSVIDKVERHDEGIVSSKHNGEKETTIGTTTQGLPSSESHTTVANVQPSHAISKGMSTAIVVHSPAGQKYGSLSSQIWDILRMIVGLNRLQGTNRTHSLHNDENHPHIMVV